MSDAIQQAIRAMEQVVEALSDMRADQPLREAIAGLQALQSKSIQDAAYRAGCAAWDANESAWESGQWAAEGNATEAQKSAQEAKEAARLAQQYADQACKMSAALQHRGEAVAHIVEGYDGGAPYIARLAHPLPPVGTKLYTAPQPVVDAVVFDILKAAQGWCRLGLACRADKQIQIAIDLLSAGKENNNE